MCNRPQKRRHSSCSIGCSSVLSLHPRRGGAAVSWRALVHPSSWARRAFPVRLSSYPEPVRFCLKARRACAPLVSCHDYHNFSRLSSDAFAQAHKHAGKLHENITGYRRSRCQRHSWQTCSPSLSPPVPPLDWSLASHLLLTKLKQNLFEDKPSKQVSRLLGNPRWSYLCGRRAVNLPSVSAPRDKSRRQEISDTYATSSIHKSPEPIYNW